MDIHLGSKRIGTLQGATINGLKIEGMWPGFFDPIDFQKEPYTLKDGNIIFEGCLLSSARGVASGSYVEFEATKRVSEAPTTSNNKKVSILPNR